MNKIHVVDSHTVGEPTRLVIQGGPDLGTGSIADRRDIFRRRYDAYRGVVVGEPRRADGVVGALLCDPMDQSSTAGVIFFDGVGYLGMCVHGTVGLVESLAYLGRVSAGWHRIETPVGVVEAELHSDGHVTVRNVPSYRAKKDVRVGVDGVGPVSGDIAWGGNWFFLVSNPGLRIDRTVTDELIDYAARIRDALQRAQVTAPDGSEIEYIQLSTDTGSADSRNFVLCPGFVYDRSPCGTGTSARLACLAADGELSPGKVWRQESVAGGCFDAYYRRERPGAIIPYVTGRAYVNAESHIILNPDDPLCWGLKRPTESRLTRGLAGSIR